MTERIAAFWTWFTANQHRFCEEDSEYEPCEDLNEELHAQLVRVRRDLQGTWEAEGSRRTLVIGAYDLGAIPVVYQIVKAAPDVPNWNVYAFGPPSSLKADSFEDNLLPVDAVWCSVGLLSQHLTLAIYCGETWTKADDLVEHARFMLEVLYGKEWLEKTFRRFTYGPLPQDPMQEGLLPSDMLPLGLDWLKLIMRDWEVQDAQVDFRVGSHNWTIRAVTRP